VGGSEDVLEPSHAGMDVRVTSHLALGVYAESLAERGHVTILGDSSLALGSLMVHLGARAVEVWDPDDARAGVEAERAPRGVTVRVLSRDQPEIRGVDLVIVPDLGMFSQPADVLARVRRMVGEEGAAIIAAANRDAAANGAAGAFDYYELFDLVAKEFDCVRMIAQLPFHGVTLAELGEEQGSPAVGVDTQLAATDRDPETFIALAGQRDVRLDTYSIIELPGPPGREMTAALERALAERSESAAELAVLLADRTRQAEQLSSELEDVRASADEQRMAATQASATAVEEVARRANMAAQRAVMLEEELRRAAGLPDEHARLEEALRERARAVTVLEAELARRDQMIHELAGALEEAASSVPGPSQREEVDGVDARDEQNASLRERLDALALELARSAGEARASEWKITELERRIALGLPPAEPSDGAQSRLSALLDEVEVLRQALVQEHEARVRAESAIAPGAPEHDRGT